MVLSKGLSLLMAVSQASLSLTNSWSLLKLMPIELVMPSNHLIVCHPLLLKRIFSQLKTPEDIQ